MGAVLCIIPGRAGRAADRDVVDLEAEPKGRSESIGTSHLVNSRRESQPRASCPQSEARFMLARRREARSCSAVLKDDSDEGQFCVTVVGVDSSLSGFLTCIVAVCPELISLAAFLAVKLLDDVNCAFTGFPFTSTLAP